MTDLLHATKTSTWRSEYTITAAGVDLVRWKNGGWERRVPFQVDGAWYAAVTHRQGRDCELHDEPGNTVATLAGVGKRRWTLEHGTRTIRLEQTSVWSQNRVAFEGEHNLGGIRRASTWNSTVVAELRGLDRPVQVFALMMFLQAMARADTAAAAGA